MPATLTTPLEQQVDRLVELGWHRLAGLSATTFRERLAPLADLAVEGPSTLVVSRRLVDPHAAVATTELHGRAGFTSMTPADLAGFVPTEHAPVPEADAYLLLDVDPGGTDTLDQPPGVVLPRILAAGRSPLTLEEGIAVVAQRGEVLEERRFSLAGSRCGDRRVPALWISERRPRLGWCWEGAPHTWLGTASCAGRVG